jgi:hypothetical protein
MFPRFVLALLLLPACVVRYGATSGNMDEAAVAQAKAKYASDAQALDALVGRADEVDQRDRLEAAWQLAKALSLNPSDQAAVAKYFDTLLQIEQRSVPQTVDAAGTEGSLDSFAPQGSKIEEETFAPGDPAPSAPAPTTPAPTTPAPTTPAPR